MGMTVKELRDILSKLPDNLEVILQKDSEGNGYSPLYAADPNCVYQPTNTWCGEVFATEWSAEDAGMNEDEWQDILKKERYLVLAPIN